MGVITKAGVGALLSVPVLCSCCQLGTRPPASVHGRFFISESLCTVSQYSHVIAKETYTSLSNLKSKSVSLRLRPLAVGCTLGWGTTWADGSV